MPTWNRVLEEIKGTRIDSPIDVVRRRYLSKLHRHTKRNVIAYYSGWLGEPFRNSHLINDEDKNGFMAVIHGLDRERGLDLILHTPGGDTAATESIVHYLHQMFGTNIRALVPQIAMSGGTMIACACQEIVMGKHSNLGPIDPQLKGIAAREVIAEFKRACEEVKKDPSRALIWNNIIGKYHPTFLLLCEKAVEWCESTAREWLEKGMLSGDPDAKEKAQSIVKGLSDTTNTLNHARHLHYDELKALGLKIVRLEDDPVLQDLLLTVHHAYMHTFSMAAPTKIIENHKGVAMVRFERAKDGSSKPKQPESRFTKK